MYRFKNLLLLLLLFPFKLTVVIFVILIRLDRMTILLYMFFKRIILLWRYRSNKTTAKFCPFSNPFSL